MSPRIATASLACLVLCACGGGETKTVTVQSPAPGTEKPAASTAADRALASRLVLRLSDLPTGWKTASGADRQTNPCPDYRQLLGSAVAARSSRDYENAQSGDEAFSRALVFKTAADARRHFDAIDFQRFADCTAAFVRQRIKNEGAPEGMKFGKVDAGEQSVPKVGDTSAGIQVEMPLSAKGIDVTLYYDAALTLQGRAVSLLALVSQLSPFDTDRKRAVMRAIAGRMPSGSE